MAYNWSAFVGQTVDGRYRLEALNADFGSRAEYAAVSESGACVIRVVSADDPGADEQLRSWEIAAGLSHPGIVRTFASGRDEIGGVPIVFAAIEPIEDHLGEAVSSRPLTEAEARDVVAALVPALEYLHGKRIAHGNVTPAGIVAADGKIKLSTDYLAEAVDRARDMRQFGGTIVEMLTQHRPAGDQAPQSIPQPLRRIASGCLQADPWTIGRVVDELAGRAQPAPVPFSKAATAAKPATLAAAPTIPEPKSPVSRNAAPTAVSLPPDEPRRFRLPGWVLGVLAVLVVAFVVYVAMKRRAPETPVAATPPPVVAERPNPIAPPQPVKPKASRTSDNWAVVAAIYRDYDLAEKRARDIERKWSQFRPAVIPAKGQGRRYLVVLGSSLPKKEAEALLRRARSSGMPRDTYVTRIRG